MAVEWLLDSPLNPIMSFTHFVLDIRSHLASCLPAAAVPTGLYDGIPMGVQIIGPRLREDLCLDAAESVERGTGILTQQLWSKT